MFVIILPRITFSPIHTMRGIVMMVDITCPSGGVHLGTEPVRGCLMGNMESISFAKRTERVRKRDVKFSYQA